eukprot:scpid57909/ scgid10088/ 
MLSLCAQCRVQCLVRIDVMLSDRADMHRRLAIIDCGDSGQLQNVLRRCFRGRSLRTYKTGYDIRQGHDSMYPLHGTEIHSGLLSPLKIFVLAQSPQAAGEVFQGVFSLGCRLSSVEMRSVSGVFYPDRRLQKVSRFLKCPQSIERQPVRATRVTPLRDCSKSALECIKWTQTILVTRQLYLSAVLEIPK